MMERCRPGLPVRVGAALVFFSGALGCQSIHLPFTRDAGAVSPEGPRVRLSEESLDPLVQLPERGSQDSRDQTVPMGGAGKVVPCQFFPPPQASAQASPMGTGSQPLVVLGPPSAIGPGLARPAAKTEQGVGQPVSAPWGDKGLTGALPPARDPALQHALLVVRGQASYPSDVGLSVDPQGDTELRPPHKVPDADTGPLPESAIFPGNLPHDGPVAPAAPTPPVPHELAKVSLAPYVIEPPDVLLVESTQSLPDQKIRGEHLVRPDGTVSLGIYGSVYVAGMTMAQAQETIGSQIAIRVKDFDLKNLYVDVVAYNSKVYYVITDGGGYGEQVTRLPITGNETVLDAIGQISGLPAVADKRCIWVARRGHGEGADQVMPVDWIGITQRGLTNTNYQVFPGDRIYVQSDHWIRGDSWLAKRIAPFERLFGITLLGSETVNSIKGSRSSTGTVP